MVRGDPYEMQVVPVAAGHGRRPPESPDTEHIRARQLDDNTAATVLHKISRAIEGSTKNDPVRSRTLLFMVATWAGYFGSRRRRMDAIEASTSSYQQAWVGRL